MLFLQAGWKKREYSFLNPTLPTPSRPSIVVHQHCHWWALLRVYHLSELTSSLWLFPPQSTIKDMHNTSHPRDNERVCLQMQQQEKRKRKKNNWNCHTTLIEKLEKIKFNTKKKKSSKPEKNVKVFSVSGTEDRMNIVEGKAKRSKPGPTRSTIFQAHNIQGEFAEASRPGSLMKLSPI